MFKLQKTVSLTLLLLLSGCSVTPFIPILKQFKTVSIASNIPAATIPCVTAESSSQPELSLREKILSETVVAFASGDFKALETAYSLYRQRTSRTPSGRWKLQYFYRAFHLDYREDETKWAPLETQLLKWIKEYPNSPAAHIAYSKFLTDRAWHLRGGKFADEVPQEAWEPFYEHIELSRNHLTRSKAIASTDPEWYVAMLITAKAEGWTSGQVNLLLQEAVSKEPYYQEIYQTAFDYLLPKWHGSFEEIEAFAEDAAVITSQCEGRSMYARIYWRALDSYSEYDSRHSLIGKHVSWEKIRAGFEDIIAHYPDEWNINNYARFACILGDKATTEKLITRIGDKPLPEAWTNQVSFAECKDWLTRDF